MNQVDNLDNLDHICLCHLPEVQMPSSSIRRRAVSAIEASSFSETEMVELIARHNPKVSRATLKTAGRAAAALSEAATRLSTEQQERLVAHREELPDLIAAVAEKLEARHDRVKLRPVGPVEAGHGSGFSERISREEGLRRLAAYATPTPLEAWAGPVAGAVELQRQYGIKRSTLHDWHQHGAVIGLLRGTRKYVCPLAQLVDGRPVQGIAQVMKAIQTPRAAWLWLSRPHPSGDGTAPIERLKAGRVAEVIEMAENDFDQS